MKIWRRDTMICEIFRPQQFCCIVFILKHFAFLSLIRNHKFACHFTRANYLVDRVGLFVAVLFPTAVAVMTHTNNKNNNRICTVHIAVSLSLSNGSSLWAPLCCLTLPLYPTFTSTSMCDCIFFHARALSFVFLLPAFDIIFTSIH